MTKMADRVHRKLPGDEAVRRDNAQRRGADQRRPWDGHEVDRAIGARVQAVARDAGQAERFGAAAFTIRDEVHVPPGLDRPRTAAGRSLLSHELVHAAQWRNGTTASARAWSRGRLEAEAQASAARLARGEHVHVAGVHRGPAPLLHPIFVSTHGNRGYLDMARAFFVRWGYGRPTDVGSVEEMLEHLSGGAGALQKVTLVSHAVPDNINIKFLRGQAGFAQEDDWAIDTPEEVADLATHVTARGLLRRVHDRLRRDDRAGPQMGAGWLDQPVLEQYLWWLVDAWFVRSQQVPRRRRRLRARLAATAAARAAALRRSAQTAAAAVLAVGNGNAAFDFDAFEAHVERILAQMVPGQMPLQQAARHVRRADNDVVERVLHDWSDTGRDDVFDHIRRVRARLDPNSHIEVQGCRVGRQASYLQAMSTFFNGARVTAPDWFQMFGRLGWRPVPDRDAAIQRLWRQERVRTAFARWYPIVTQDPLPDDAGWEQLAEFLRDGHPLLVGGRLISVEGEVESAFLDLLARHAYRISREEDLREQFLEGRSFGGAMRFTLIDWLQEQRGRNSPMLFRPDPEYWNHIRSS